MNRLQHETSPYLLQHADNPVDWYPWGQEALDYAKAEDKPILLSIGYSACHWCHVMAHESFEDPETAAMMNDLFVNVKVDREERPDVDDIYMQATLAFTRGHGGWPMTVFLTPDGKPFHAGTYFPPEPRYMHGQLAIPSFRQVMVAVADYFQKQRDEVEQVSADVAQAIQSGLGIPLTTATKDEFSLGLLDKAGKKLISSADTIYGGLHRGQPKFPSPMNLEFLLRQYSTSGDDDFLKPVLFTLQKMAQGGIYDQLGGGFHRYSVDARWLVPHFEKMLYDNAQLVRVYVHAYQITTDEFYASVAHDILRYVMREMLDATGGFYSTQDADSEGEEGKFFVWTPEEMHSALTEDFSESDIDAFMALYDITASGNFEGHNIPNRLRDIDDVADEIGRSVDELSSLAARIRPVLFAYREQRIKPGLDDKMLTAWNGMMLAAFAEAARVLDDDSYREIAVNNAKFVLAEMRMDDSRLYRTHKRIGDGGESKILGYLEDYANLIDGLLELYQTTFDAEWFTEANRLAEFVLDHFITEGTLYDTSDEHEALVARPRAIQDNATPAGGNLMALNWARLYGYTGDRRFRDAADNLLGTLTAAMQEYPSAFGTALQAMHLTVNGVREVAVIGERTDAATQSLLNVIQKPYRPLVITAQLDTPASEDIQPQLLAQRPLRNEQPTVYVCQEFVCQQPVNAVEEVESLLN